mgnify:CR=1 FL=1
MTLHLLFELVQPLRLPVAPPPRAHGGGAGRRPRHAHARAHLRLGEEGPRRAVGGVVQPGEEDLWIDFDRELQKLGAFDTKTSSWILTPKEIRKDSAAVRMTEPSSGRMKGKPAISAAVGTTDASG